MGKRALAFAITAGAARSFMPKSVHTPAYQLFRKMLQEKRESLGLKQRALSRLLKQHHTYVNLCESGERQLNIVELREWCQKLRISFPEFVKELDDALTQQEKEERSNMEEESTTEE